jgi:hypothetical protein
MLNAAPARRALVMAGQTAALHRPGRVVLPECGGTFAASRLGALEGTYRMYPSDRTLSPVIQRSLRGAPTATRRAMALRLRRRVGSALMRSAHSGTPVAARRAFLARCTGILLH